MLVGDVHEKSPLVRPRPLPEGDIEMDFGEICCVHKNVAELAQDEMVRFCDHDD
jgi:hypothetical protein